MATTNRAVRQTVEEWCDGCHDVSLVSCSSTRGASCRAAVGRTQRETSGKAAIATTTDEQTVMPSSRSIYTVTDAQTDGRMPAAAAAAECP